MIPTRRARTIFVLAVVLVLAVSSTAWLTRSAWWPSVADRLGWRPPQEVWVCPMHPEVTDTVQSRCPTCGMKLERPAAPAAATPAPVEAPALDARAPVSLDARRQQLIGVRTATVTRETVAGRLRAVGSVRYDETRQFDVNVKVEGWIRELYVDYTGRAVAAGDPLFTLYSPDLLTTQNELLLALKTRDATAASEVADARAYAARLVDVARQRLALWDVSPADLATLERERSALPEITFRAPVGGIVLDKQAIKGKRVMPGETLYRLADLSSVWVEADFYEGEAAAIAVGSRGDITLDAYPGETFAGRVSYVYPYVDEATRTVRVRLALGNPRGRLKPGMFASVSMALPSRPALLVPRDAVVDSGTRRIVFVAQGDGYFEPRDVTIGRRLEDRIEVLEGLTAGEAVAAAATFFIDSESQINAALGGFAAAPPPGVPSGSSITATLRTTPDPPRAGDNEFEITVLGPDGAPLTGDDAAVVFFMPAMPSMNMPAMRSDARLPHVGNGVYRGRSDLMMSGKWDLTVTVHRSGQAIGTARLPLLAK